MIDGVKIIPKKKIVDSRGAIYHMLRKDDPEFQKFGEIYFSQVLPGVVKGWHLHSKMTLNYLLVVGSIHLVLYDGRENSSTRSMVQEILLEEKESKLVIVPPFVWNGFKGLGKAPSILANCATEPHDASEITRIAFDDPSIPYKWEQGKT